MKNIFIALDGDNVGKQLEYLSFTNDIGQLKDFSKIFSEKMNWLQQELISTFNAEIIIFGGDNLMASLEHQKNMSDFLNKLKAIFDEFQVVGKTLSAGIGETPREAFIALNFAKSSGKNRIKMYGDYTNEPE